MLRDFVQTHAPERLSLIRVIRSELAKGDIHDRGDGAVENLEGGNAGRRMQRQIGVEEARRVSRADNKNRVDGADRDAGAGDPP